MFKKSLKSVDVLFGPQMEKPAGRLDNNIGLIPVHPPIKQSQFDASECDEKLLALRKAHAMLCEVASMVNGMYGFQV